MAADAKTLAKQHATNPLPVAVPGEAAGSAAAETPKCTATTLYMASVQTMQRGNEQAFFPVAHPASEPPRRTGGAAAARGGGGPQAPPTSAVVPLETFLGVTDGTAVIAGGRMDPSAALATSESTANSQCAGLMQMYRFDRDLKKLNWTAAKVVEHFGRFTGAYKAPTNAELEEGEAALDPTGPFFFACLKWAVLLMFRDALKFLRECDPTILLRMSIGGQKLSAEAADDVLKQRPLNVHEEDTTVVRYARDVAMLVYTHLELVRIGDRPKEQALAEDGLSVPPLSDRARTAARDVRKEYQKSAAKFINMTRV